MHLRELEKERRRSRESAEKRYADSQVKAYAAQSEFTQLKQDMEKMRAEGERFKLTSQERLAGLDQKVNEILGVVRGLRDATNRIQ